LVPVIIHRVDPAMVGSPEFALKLQVVRWIGKDQVDRILGKRGQDDAAVSDQNLVQGKCWIVIRHNGLIVTVFQPFGQGCYESDQGFPADPIKSQLNPRGSCNVLIEIDRKTAIDWIS